MSHRSLTHVGGVLGAVLLSIFVATPSAAIQITSTCFHSQPSAT
jgi:hypothetical protein